MLNEVKCTYAAKHRKYGQLSRNCHQPETNIAVLKDNPVIYYLLQPFPNIVISYNKGNFIFFGLQTNNALQHARKPYS